jgi:hypothetical protein
MKKKIKTVPCSDWHLGWGFGHDHIGKLTINDDASTADCILQTVFFGKVIFG